ncbi:site-specific integrase [Conchiformibius steedae]|uniref:tyrosine-type recombinase/integrase n=1 Tax=Conchiformibius steedae TaxID=153493 RepID=UPI0026F2A7C3|nr:site-specific integrase [Conchiformibius steedae]
MSKMSFRAAAEKWLPEHLALCGAEHQQRVHNLFTRWAYPTLGKQAINRITPQQIVVCIKAHEQHAPSVAPLLLQKISKLYHYAKAMGWARYNPAEGLHIVLKPIKYKGFNFVQPEKMPEFLAAVDTFTDPEAAETVAFWLICHTAVRRAEAVQADLREVDFDRALWTIPAERIKTRQPHIVPLSEPVLELLHKWLAQRQQQGITGNRLFGDLPLHRPIETIRKAGYDGKMTLHGCRKVFSTAAHESGLWGIDAIELQLAHTIGGVRGVYNKAQYLDERRRLMDWYSSELQRWRNIGHGGYNGVLR